MPVHYSYTSTPLSTCTVQLYLYSPQCLNSTAIALLPSVPVEYSYSSTPLSTYTVQLYLYSPQCLYSTAIPLLPLWAVRSVQSLSACRVQLYLYSSYGPYGLYRASVTVQYSYICTPPMGRTACTELQCLYSTAIPLLPLWAVRPVQSLSVYTVHLYLYSPHRPYGLYRASVTVQYIYTSTPPMGRTACTEPRCLYSTAILLLPLCAVRPVQTLSTCTVQLYLYSHYGPYGLCRPSVPVQYNYTSTSPMDRTACAEPQRLYSTRVHFTLLYIIF